MAIDYESNRPAVRDRTPQGGIVAVVGLIIPVVCLPVVLFIGFSQPSDLPSGESNWDAMVWAFRGMLIAGGLSAVGLVLSLVALKMAGARPAPVVAVALNGVIFLMFVLLVVRGG